MKHVDVCVIVVVRVDDTPIRLQLCDTAGQVGAAFVSSITIEYHCLLLSVTAPYVHVKLQKSDSYC